MKTTPEQMLQKLGEHFSRIRLGRGVVARTGHGMVALLALWGVVAWRWSGSLSDIGLLLIGAIATGTYVWWARSTQSFAERNPAQAMLEGAEFVEYSKFQAQVKGLPPGDSPLVEDKGSSGG